MTAEDILKTTIGDLVFQNAVLQAKISELESKLRASEDAVKPKT